MHNGAFGTHVPMLAASLALVPRGPVLELGSGWWSTLTLHAICAAQGYRRLVTADSNTEWLAKFSHLQTPWHVHEVVTDWATHPAIEREPWAVVFIDQWPPLMRGNALVRLAQRAQLIVMHDSETPEPCGYEPAMSGFKYRYDHKAVMPHTTVVSNFVALPW